MDPLHCSWSTFFFAAGVCGGGDHEEEAAEGEDGVSSQMEGLESQVLLRSMYMLMCQNGDFYSYDQANIAENHITYYYI